MSTKKRIVIVSSHPIQYNAPLFVELAKIGNGTHDYHVLYTRSPGEVAFDNGFQRMVEWDIPLLEDYKWSFLNNRSSTCNILLSIAKLKPDIVWFFGYREPGYFWVVNLLRLTPVKLVFRGSSNLFVPESKCRRLLKAVFFTLFFRSFDLILFQGVANRAYFLMGAIDEERMSFAPHVVHADRLIQNSLNEKGYRRFLNRLNLEDEPDVFRFLFVGKFQPLKRPDIIVDAFIRFLEVYPHNDQVECIFVGEGELWEELRSSVAHDQRLKFFGFLNQTEVPFAYRYCDVLILPSISETWGLVVNEAMAFGLPCIVSDRVGCKDDLIESSVTGSIFEVDDVEELLSSMIKWYELWESKSINVDYIKSRMRDSWSLNRAAELMHNALSEL